MLNGRNFPLIIVIQEKKAFMGEKSHFGRILFHSLEKFIFPLDSHN